MISRGLFLPPFQRMCVVCRKKKDKNDFFRIVRGRDAAVRIDFDSKLPGRGAYVCKSHECVESKKITHALSRALRTNVDLSISEELLKLVKSVELEASRL